MQGTKKTLPKFKSEEEERNFWIHEDSTQFIDWAKGKRAKRLVEEHRQRTVPRK